MVNTSHNYRVLYLSGYTAEQRLEYTPVVHSNTIQSLAVSSGSSSCRGIITVVVVGVLLVTVVVLVVVVAVVVVLVVVFAVVVVVLIVILSQKIYVKLQNIFLD